MEEILVLTACLYQKGCPETASHLYNQRPHLQEFVSKTETKIKTLAGPFIVDYLTPTILFASGATGSVHLYRNLSMKYNRTTLTVVFKKEF
jgi:hypothetical protein